MYFKGCECLINTQHLHKTTLKRQLSQGYHGSSRTPWTRPLPNGLTYHHNFTLFRLPTMSILWCLHAPGQIQCLQASPDGRFIATQCRAPTTTLVEGVLSTNPSQMQIWCQTPMLNQPSDDSSGGLSTANWVASSLSHPMEVVAFSWRSMPRYLPPYVLHSILTLLSFNAFLVHSNPTLTCLNQHLLWSEPMRLVSLVILSN